MRNPEKITFNALKVSQPIGDFFIASMKAKDLVRISTTDIRRLEEREVEKYLGVQRPLSLPRVKKIQDYVRRSDATFPTSIILAISEKCAYFDDNTNTLTLSEYLSDDDLNGDQILVTDIAKILDGQHRIAGFYERAKRASDLNKHSFATDLEQVDFDLTISIFVGADIAEQGNIFATVNHEQQKVNKSLVYDLMALAKHRSPQKSCHNIAVALDSERNPDSPLKERIKRLGIRTPGRDYEPLTQATFVESLIKFISIDPYKDREMLKLGKKLPLADEELLKKCPFRNMFIQEKDADIYQIILNYFSAIERKWIKAWNNHDVKGNFIPRSNAFKAFMKYLLTDAYANVTKFQYGQVPTVEEFSELFNHIELSDNTLTTKVFVPGSGGQSMFYQVLKGEIPATQLYEG